MNKFHNFSLLAVASLALVAVSSANASAASFACDVLQFCPNVQPDADGDIKTSNVRHFPHNLNPHVPSYPTIPNLPPELSQPYSHKPNTPKIPELSEVPTYPGDPRTEKATHPPIENLPPELSQPWSAK